MSTHPDPRTCFIQGDISRNDAVTLHRYGEGKRVVEFGMGGSTLLLAHWAARVDSYETDKEWYELTAHRVRQLGPNAEVELHLCPTPPESIPSADVLFVDGVTNQRAAWMHLHHRKVNTILVHDTRRKTDFQQVLDWLGIYFLEVERLEVLANDSNITVIQKRKQPLAYEDWGLTEAHDNRVSWTQKDYVPA